CTRVWRGRSVARARTRRRCFFWGLTVVVCGVCWAATASVSRESAVAGHNFRRAVPESPKSSKLLNWTGRVRVSTSSKFPFAPEKPTKLARGVNCEGGSVSDRSRRRARAGSCGWRGKRTTVTRVPGATRWM
ncbi:unnamed protein product, partial [Ixodes persulcatus]